MNGFRYDWKFSESLPENLQQVYEYRQNAKAGPYETAEMLRTSVSFVRWAEKRIEDRWASYWRDKILDGTRRAAEIQNEVRKERPDHPLEA